MNKVFGTLISFSLILISVVVFCMPSPQSVALNSSVAVNVHTESTLSELEQLKRENDARQAQLKAQIGNTSSAAASLSLRIDAISNYEIPRTQLEMRLLEKKERDLQARNAELASKLTNAEEQKARISEQIDITQTGHDLAKKAIHAMAREDLRDTMDAQTLKLILSAEDSTQFVNDLQMDASLARTIARLNDRYSNDKAQLATKDARLNAVDKRIRELTEETAQNQIDTKNAQQAAGIKLAEAQALVTEMAQKQAQLQAQLGTLQAQKTVSDAERNRIDEEMAGLIADEINNGGGLPNGDAFDAGNIIADAKFYTGGTMSVSEIQNFLNQKGANCYTNCLKDYRVTSYGGYLASGNCDGFPDGVNMSAAEAISNAAKSCHISEKVLLVMLQKEQGLLTMNAPENWRYSSALGYACPDDGSCDATKGGLFNQLYAAAWQFNYYKANSLSFRYKPFMNNQIQYHPNVSCGAKSVYISNYATAGLYNYTPYTPNDAAINAGLGLGDSCSSYGNRNFYYLYLSWFGSSK